MGHAPTILCEFIPGERHFQSSLDPFSISTVHIQPSQINVFGKTEIELIRGWIRDELKMLDILEVKNLKIERAADRPECRPECRRVALQPGAVSTRHKDPVGHDALGD